MKPRVLPICLTLLVVLSSSFVQMGYSSPVVEVAQENSGTVRQAYDPLSYITSAEVEQLSLSLR